MGEKRMQWVWRYNKNDRAINGRKQKAVSVEIE
jgi:hypothetical protein